MLLKYIAHSTFCLTSSTGTKILTDPYEPGCFDNALAYGPINKLVDAITISHSHVDHSYIAPEHAQAKVFKTPGKYNFNDIEIFGLQVFHDEHNGKDRGSNIIFRITIDDIIVCHLGDLGHILNKETIEVIGPVDVLLIPVGGVYTIDNVAATTIMQTISPKICIPMHYKTNLVAFPLNPVEYFTKNKNNVTIMKNCEIELSKKQLPQTTEILVLCNN